MIKHTMMQKKFDTDRLPILFPLLFSFFVMGFVDVVGIATSYVKQDFALNDKLANLLPMMVFLWFAVCSLPTSIIMGKIGRKKTVLISAAITSVGMIIPVIDYSFVTVLIAFALLGIGNTILQVSLNPLLANAVSKDKITSMLTLGQFIKAISSFLGPVLVSFAAGAFGDWKFIFPTYALLTILSFVWLVLTPIVEEIEPAAQNKENKIVSLLKSKYLLALFSVIVLIVGFEIGLMTAVPKYLQEYFSLPLEKGALACSLYYIARTIGTFAGSILLAKVSSRKFFILSMAVAVLSFIAFMIAQETWLVFVSLFMVGLSCANVFPIVFSDALQSDQSKVNEISALMIMGVAGGALIPPVMGVVADMAGQYMSLFVLLAILAYMFFTAVYIIKK